MIVPLEPPCAVKVSVAAPNPTSIASPLFTGAGRGLTLSEVPEATPFPNAVVRVESQVTSAVWLLGTLLDTTVVETGVEGVALPS